MNIDTNLLNSAQEDLWEIRAKLCKLQEKLAPFPYGACAHEISQTLRCLGIAEDQIKRTRNPKPLPTLEEVQAIYKQYQKPERDA